MSTHFQKALGIEWMRDSRLLPVPHLTFQEQLSSKKEYVIEKNISKLNLYLLIPDKLYESITCYLMGLWFNFPSQAFYGKTLKIETSHTMYTWQFQEKFPLSHPCFPWFIFLKFVSGMYANLQELCKIKLFLGKTWDWKQWLSLQKVLLMWIPYE